MPDRRILRGKAHTQDEAQDPDSSEGLLAYAAGKPTAAQLLAVARKCPKSIATGLPTDADGDGDVTLCGGTGGIWFTGDADIDCDGKKGSICNKQRDPAYLGETSCEDSSGKPLDAQNLPFVVWPGDQPSLKKHFKGVGCGQVVAVIYKNTVVYGVTGDTTEDDGTGEFSYGMCKALGLSDSNCDPKTGGISSGVTYIYFTGSGSKVSNITDRNATTTLGQKLAAQLVAKN